MHASAFHDVTVTRLCRNTDSVRLNGIDIDINTITEHDKLECLFVIALQDLVTKIAVIKIA